MSGLKRPSPEFYPPCWIIIIIKVVITKIILKIKITDTVKVEEAKSRAEEIADATRTTTTTQEGVDAADDEVDEVTMLTMMTMTL